MVMMVSILGFLKEQFIILNLQFILYHTFTDVWIDFAMESRIICKCFAILVKQLAL